MSVKPCILMRVIFKLKLKIQSKFFCNCRDALEILLMAVPCFGKPMSKVFFLNNCISYYCF